eukprot:CAMPEP_0174754688 /NCGR_PEP_ID=MMETSP1094-20130205/105868_1 /TAXON_ID=156173 /ORGANISM="Chrysochromulina brevifilum, Strain UTEX LB 985" /LENGTH=520 /DNA_ID=CAMNT_0015960567 /DNA_START=14 /DNA_END=1577 /DNA_ORIENTATION=-
MPAPREFTVSDGFRRMEMLKKMPAGPQAPLKDEFGRLIEFTGEGYQTAGDRIMYHSGKNSSTSKNALAPVTDAPYGQGGALISYGSTPARKPKEPLPADSSVKDRILNTNEKTLPGDLLVRKSGLSIESRMAALIRQRSIDMPTVILDFLHRPGFSRMPPRGHGLVDIPTFRRALCYAFGEQWLSLGMTSPEFMQTYSPYIAREQNEAGDALILWKAFCTDIMKKAGVDKGDLGYLREEVDLAQRVSVTNQEQDNLTAEQLAELNKVRDTEFSHDIETEEEKQIRVLKDIERVTGARSVAVTRYGSYEAKLHGRNSLGVIKQGEFDRIGISDEKEAQTRAAQGINADGSRVKSVNTQISGQTHEYAADGTIEVSGVDIVYDAKKAANATSYSADKQQSLAGQGPTKEQIANAERRKAEAARQDAIRSKAAYSPMIGNSADPISNQITTGGGAASTVALREQRRWWKLFVQPAVMVEAVCAASGDGWGCARVQLSSEWRWQADVVEAEAQRMPARFVVLDD